MSTSESSEPGSRRRGRMHDAEGARQAILDAGEEVFAQHGFDGARIDAIAEAAGYNKSLIFQYFGDKLGLYAAVIRRADDQTRVWQDDALKTLLVSAPARNAARIRDLLRKYVGLYFDYVAGHPTIMRIFNWEMAEGWQTFSKIMTERDRQDVDLFAPVFENLQKTGLVRRQPNAFMQLTTALFMCQVYLAIVPLYHLLLPGEDITSPAVMAKARTFVVDFVTNGLLLSPVEA